MKKFLKVIYPYVIIFVVVILIRMFIITPVTVVGTSMVDTLMPDEILLLSKISYRVGDIERYDIVVIDEGNDKLIKRVYGLPGDIVEYRDNTLFINDEEVKDPYASNETSDFTIQDICIRGLQGKNLTEEELEQECDYTSVPEGYYLVLGDNRGISLDSRSFGFVDRKIIEGKAVFRIYPFNKIGGIS